ncbi:unnamed protein product [Auanema sp. JU1783]|nr:unnamed protein product [Auanema sp. JU1783]
MNKLTTMRAAVINKFGPAENIEICSNVAIPKITEPNQILIKVEASGVNPVDTYIRSGNYNKLPQLPYTPGRDGAGVVNQVGSAVTKVRPGDRVWFTLPTTGSAAEYALTSSNVFCLPDCLTFAEGSRLGIPFMTAYRALVLRGQAKKGDKILIHGASGSVGVAAVQLANMYGMIVVGTAGSGDGLNLVKKLGAQNVFNHRSGSYVNEIKEKYPEGFDLILEMAAHINLSHDLGLLKKNGRIGVIGCRGDVNISPRQLMSSETTIFGVMLGHSTPEEFEQMGLEITSLLNSECKPLVSRVYALDEISKAHEHIINNDTTLGSITLELR